MGLRTLVQSAFLAAVAGCGGAPLGPMETGEVESTVCSSLLEGEFRTYTLGSKAYDTTVTYIEQEKVKFVINGEATNKVAREESYTLADQSQVTVEDILYQDYAGGVHQAWFCLSAAGE